MGNVLCKGRNSNTAPSPNESRSSLGRVINRCSEILPTSIGKKKHFWDKQVLETSPPQADKPIQIQPKQKDECWRNVNLAVPDNGVAELGRPTPPPRKKRPSMLRKDGHPNCSIQTADEESDTNSPNLTQDSRKNIICPVTNTNGKVFSISKSVDKNSAEDISSVPIPISLEDKNTKSSSVTSLKRKDETSSSVSSLIKDDEKSSSTSSLTRKVSKVGNKKSDKFFGENLSDCLSDEPILPPNDETPTLEEGTSIPENTEQMRDSDSNIHHDRLAEANQKSTHDNPSDQVEKTIDEVDRARNLDNMRALQIDQDNITVIRPEENSLELSEKIKNETANLLFSLKKQCTKESEIDYSGVLPVEEIAIIPVKRKIKHVCDNDESLSEHLHHKIVVDPFAPKKPQRDFSKYKKIDDVGVVSHELIDSKQVNISNEFIDDLRQDSAHNDVNALKSTQGSIVSALDPTKGNIANTLNSVKDSFVSSSRSAKDNVVSTLNTTKDSAVSTAQLAKDTVKTAVQPVSERLVAESHLVHNKVADSLDSAKDDITTKLESARNNIGYAAESAKNHIVTASQSAKDNIVNASETAKDKALTTFESAKNNVEVASESTKDRVLNAAQSARDNVVTAFGSIKDSTELTKSNIVEATQSAKDSITTRTEAVMNKVETASESAKHTIENATNSAKGKLENSMDSQAKDNVVTAASLSAKDSILSTSQSVKSDIADISKSTHGNIVSALESAKAIVVSAMMSTNDDSVKNQAQLANESRPFDSNIVNEKQVAETVEKPNRRLRKSQTVDESRTTPEIGIDLPDLKSDNVAKSEHNLSIHKDENLQHSYESAHSKMPNSERVLRKCLSSQSFLTEDLVEKIAQQAKDLSHSHDFVPYDFVTSSIDGSGTASPSSKLEKKKSLSREISHENPEAIGKNEEDGKVEPKKLFNLLQNPPAIEKVSPPSPTWIDINLKSDESNRNNLNKIKTDLPDVQKDDDKVSDLLDKNEEFIASSNIKTEEFMHFLEDELGELLCSQLMMEKNRIVEESENLLKSESEAVLADSKATGAQDPNSKVLRTETRSILDDTTERPADNDHNPIIINTDSERSLEIDLTSPLKVQAIEMLKANEKRRHSIDDLDSWFSTKGGSQENLDEGSSRRKRSQSEGPQSLNIQIPFDNRTPIKVGATLEECDEQTIEHSPLLKFFDKTTKYE